MSNTLKPSLHTPGGPYGHGKSIILFGAGSVSQTITDRFLFPMFANSPAITSEVKFKVPFKGILGNMFLIQEGDGNGNDVVFTLRLNGVNTSLVITVPSTSNTGQNLDDIVPVVEGDELSFIVTKALSIGSSLDNPVISIGLGA